LIVPEPGRVSSQAAGMINDLRAIPDESSYSEITITIKMRTGKTSRAFYETFRLIWRGLREFSRGRFCGLAPIGPDDVAKDAGKLADFIGLGHHSAKAIFRILGHDRIIGVTAGDNGPG